MSVIFLENTVFIHMTTRWENAVMSGFRQTTNAIYFSLCLVSHSHSLFYLDSMAGQFDMLPTVYANDVVCDYMVLLHAC